MVSELKIKPKFFGKEEDFESKPAVKYGKGDVANLLSDDMEMSMGAFELAEKLVNFWGESNPPSSYVYSALVLEPLGLAELLNTSDIKSEDLLRCAKNGSFVFDALNKKERRAILFALNATFNASDLVEINLRKDADSEAIRKRIKIVKD